MNRTSHSVPRISMSTYVALRPNRDGILDLEAVRQARFNIAPGGRVVISIYGCRNFTGDAASQIGRIVADGGASDVFLQISGSGRVANRLLEAVQMAAAQFAEAMSS